MLPDVLRNNLDVVFCGTAKGSNSAATGFYYNGTGNRFYQALFEYGFIPILLKPSDCYEISKYGIGLTDLVSI